MEEMLSGEQYQTIEDVLHLRFKYLEESLARLKDHTNNKEDERVLQEVLSEEFSRIGLHTDDEPNDLGKKIDEIVSKLDFES